MCPWLSILSFNPTWGGSRSWCTTGHPSFVFVVVYTPTWDSSKSWCALGCPCFLSILRGVVAGAGVPLATHLLFLFLLFIHLRGTVAKAGVLLAVHLFFQSYVGGSRSWCTPGHKSFVLLLLFIHLCGTVAKAGVVLTVHLSF